MTNKLNRVTDIAVLIVCIVSIMHFGEGYYRRYVISAATYKVGDKIPSTPALDLTKSRQTLLMYTATTCHFCSESMPFYREVTKSAQAGGTRIVGVATEDLRANRAYLQANRIPADTVVSAKANKLRVVGTPTLILVGSDGAVRKSWVGKLSPDHEREVLVAVAKS